MSYKMITGLPGSGKTYYAVWYIASTYFYRTKSGKFKLKDKYKDIKIISNIEALKLPHLSLDDVLKNYRSPSEFFSYASQEKISKKYPQIVYLIDEAQFFFPARFRDDAVFNWFQLHRHFGQDIYLITQVSRLLPDAITNLCEMQIDAVPRSNTIFFGRDLHWNFLSKGQIIDKTWKFKRKWVFDLYTSQSSEEVEKPQNPFIKYFALILLFLFFGIWNSRKLFQKDESPSISSSSPSSKTINKQDLKPSSSSSSSLSPETEKLIPVSLSYLTENGIVYVVFQGIFYKFKEFPFEITNGPFKTLVAQIPESLLDAENGKNDSKKEKESFF